MTATFPEVPGRPFFPDFPGFPVIFQKLKTPEFSAKNAKRGTL
jgi:hypothetical protein